MGKVKSLKTIDGVWFVELQNFLHNAVSMFTHNGVPTDQVEIYMPKYILAMWQHYIMNNVGHEVKPKFMGVLIYPNYENNIVVSFEEIHFTEHKPKILQIK